MMSLILRYWLNKFLQTYRLHDAKHGKKKRSHNRNVNVSQISFYLPVTELKAAENSALCLDYAHTSEWSKVDFI